MFFWRRSHAISEEQLSAYIDGQLDDADAARLEAHAESCSACRDALAELRTVRSTLRELPQVAAPRSFALREADVRPAPATRVSGGRAPALLGGLASVALVAFLTLVSVDVLDRGSSGGDAATVSGAAADRSTTEQQYSDAEVGDGETQLRENTLGQSGAPSAGSAATPAAREPAVTGPVPAADDGAQPEGGAPEATTRAAVDDDGVSDALLRAGEVAAAAVALAAAGGFAFAWRRRRASG